MRYLLAALAAGSALLGAYHYLATERQDAWQNGYDTAEAKGDKALEALKRSHVETLLAQAEAFEAEQTRYQNRVQDIESRYLTQRQGLEHKIAALEGALNEAYTDHYRPAPDSPAKPVPECVFTVGWLRDYNAALGGVQATAARAGQLDAAPWPAPGAEAEFTNSEISQRQLLRHAQRYGQWCQANTHQLTSLIEAVNAEGQP